MEIVSGPGRCVEKGEQYYPIIFHKQMEGRGRRVQDFQKTGESFLQKALSQCDPEVEHKRKTTAHRENRQVQKLNFLTGSFEQSCLILPNYFTF